MPSSAAAAAPRDRSRSGWLLAVCTLVYLAVLLLGGVVPWWPIVIQWLPALVGCVAVCRARAPSWESVCAAAALTAYAMGNTYFYTTLALTGSLPPFPSAADVGYLSFTPLMLIALAVAVRRQMRDLSWSVWLDTALGSLAASAALAVVLNPVLGSASAMSWSAGTAVALAYPSVDLLMVAAVVGIVTLQGLRVARRWMPLLAGLAPAFHDGPESLIPAT